MLRKVLVGLSLIGLVDSIYLTYVKLVSSGLCVAGEGCEIVNSSIYSQINGIPVAALGAVAYASMLVVLLLEDRVNFIEFNSPLIVFGMSLFGVLYSAYLTYLEIYVIRAICPFCVLSAVVLSIMLVLSGVRLQRSLKTA
ncbi:MAG TPA: vitamin K epoxide reductase family protein [Anaerolineales bacterium]|nr:vitamin K epoxide reductase family protein [Anaerolineales bacterium]